MINKSKNRGGVRFEQAAPYLRLTLTPQIHEGMILGGEGGGVERDSQDGAGDKGEGQPHPVSPFGHQSGHPRSSPSSAIRRRLLQIPSPEWPPLLFTGPPRRQGRGRRAVGGGAADRIRSRPPRAPPRTRHGGGVRALPGRACGGGVQGRGEAVAVAR
jgi:hypothetical protein